MEAHATGETANDRFKGSFSETFWYSIASAVVVHAVLFAFWPAMTTADVSTSPEEITTVDLPSDVTIPPPPEQLARPAAPVIASADVADDVTITPLDFETYTPQRLPAPPQVTRDDGELSDFPRMVPRTVEPELLNRSQVQQALTRTYPPLLREAGIGGTATVWFFIDEDGRVQRRLLNRRSGHEALDEAALKVAEVMRFSPAMNRDRKVGVWVEIPIVFTTR